MEFHLKIITSEHDDKDIGIKWPLTDVPLNINDRDRNWPSFEEYKAVRNIKC